MPPWCSSRRTPPGSNTTSPCPSAAPSDSWRVRRHCGPPRGQTHEVGVGRQVQAMFHVVEHLADHIAAIDQVVAWVRSVQRATSSSPRSAPSPASRPSADHDATVALHRDQRERRAAHRKLAADGGSSKPRTECQRWKQQHGREFRDQRKHRWPLPRSAVAACRLLQILHPQHGGEEEEGRHREIRGDVASMRDQIRVERAECGPRSPAAGP